MIFYFSGTGNSKHVAERIGELLNEHVVSIAHYYQEVTASDKFKINVGDDKFLGFVCPVHSWGIALSMRRFLKRVKINYTGKKIFGIVVCGDNCGKAREQMQELLLKKSGLNLSFVCSVQMPNNYIVMKGFGTDSDELAKQKLEAAEKQLPEIADALLNDKPYEHYVAGTKPFLKGRIIYPLFMKFTLGDKKFFADDNCNSCGLCEKSCPENNIKILDGKPKWQGHCVKCLACIHRCPQKAIQYGDITQSMGRYFFKK